MILILAAFLIAFAVAVPPSTTRCLGRIVDSTERHRVGTTISLAYRITVGALALLIGALFIVAGSLLFWRIKKSGADSNTSRQLRLYVLTAVCSLSLIGMAIFNLAIAGTADYRNNVASLIVTLIIEALPGAIILGMIDSRVTFTKSSSIQKGSKGTGSTAGNESATQMSSKVKSASSTKSSTKSGSGSNASQ